MDLSSSGTCSFTHSHAWDTQLYTLAMITTLMPHLRIGPYNEGVTIDQIQIPFHAVGRSFSYELLVIYIPTHIYIADMGTKEVSKCTVTSERSIF